MGLPMKQLWIACLGIIDLTTGCGQPQDAHIAQVGPYPITAAALRTFVEELPEGLRIKERGEAGRRRYLQELIDSRLLLLEARARGLDTTATVRAAVQNAVDARASLLYRSREIVSRIEVTDEEVRRHFETERYDVERKLCAILVESREKLEGVIDELQAGKSFEEVARAHSLDGRSAQRGGELGFIGREMALRLHVPPDLFRSLPLGQISDPLQVGSHWHVVRFTEEREVDFAKHRDFIHSRLFKEREAQAEEEHLEQLGQAFQVRLNADGLKEMMTAYRERDLDGLTTNPRALYVYDRGEITVSQAYQSLRLLNRYRALSDSAASVSALKKVVLHPLLITGAAQRAGIYDEPGIRQLEKERLEDALLEALRRVAVTQHISVSEEEARQYYDNHPELFHHEASTWVQELLLSTEVEALQVRQQLEAGADFEALAGISLREAAIKNGAQFHFHPREKVIYPRLIPAIMAAAPGELVGPMEVNKGYSVFRVLRRDERKMEPFASAGRRARALVRRQRENQGLEALIKHLRTRYASQIKVDESQLQKALPDDLLGS